MQIQRRAANHVSIDYSPIKLDIKIENGIATCTFQHALPGLAVEHAVLGDVQCDGVNVIWQSISDATSSQLADGSCKSHC